MWSYISISQNLRASEPYESWMTTQEYNASHVVKPY